MLTALIVRTFALRHEPVSPRQRLMLEFRLPGVPVRLSRCPAAELLGWTPGVVTTPGVEVELAAEADECSAATARGRAAGGAGLEHPL